MTVLENPGLEDPRLNSCPACGQRSYKLGSWAVISPWVLELSGEAKSITTEYRVCSFCKSSWFNHSFSPKILDSLYRSYRGEEYFRIRNSWEPTYTKQLNSELNSGVEWLDGRRAQITKSLESAGLKPTEMESVLDFGGGHGGVMPKFPKRYLLEANESADPEIGVQLIRQWEEAQKLSLNLVMCCGVLEHLNQPASVVTTILELESDIYLFEVPAGIPATRKGLSANRLFLKVLSSNKFLWREIQKLERRLSRAWRIYFPLRCSEHLQFFSREGLSQLLENCGLEVLVIQETNPNQALTDEKNLGFETGLIAVCRKNKS